MANETVTAQPPTLLDLSGLPDPVVRSLQQLVESLRAAPVVQSDTNEKAPRQPLVGRFAHLGISVPKEAVDDAQREAWAGFPRDIPDQ